jgi:acyl-[acyl-carrier-protein]-phospholipid O-acyltransferase/long-chain-fatty-acid--[acyl-carrier-protein] ligase
MHSNSTIDPRATAPQSGSRGLLSASFLGLLLTQFLGATNDNILRWLIIGIGKDYFEAGDVSKILALGTAVFVAPYILLAAPAGFLADRFSKRTVIVSCKVAEIFIMALAIVSIIWGQVWFMLTVLGLIGSQAALFGPAKLGSIPEILKEKYISNANGLIGLTTVLATMIGTTVGSLLADKTGDRGQEHWQWSAAVLIGFAIAGWLASLAISKQPAGDPTRTFPWNALQQTWTDLKTLAHTPAMLRVAFGILFFWTLAALAHLNIDQFAFEAGGEKQTQVAPLLAALVIGVGAGSVLAGVWSNGRVELGILPLGALGLVLVPLALFTVEGEFFIHGGDWTISYIAAGFLLFLLGCSAGLFDVPLAAYMQFNSPPDRRGSILAASNFMTFSGMLLASLAFFLMRLPTDPGTLENLQASYTQQPQISALATEMWTKLETAKEAGQPLDVLGLAHDYRDHEGLAREVHQEFVGPPLFTARQIFLFCGMLTIPVLIYILFMIPQASIRFLAWLLTHTVYKIRVRHRDYVPDEGGALLVPNHVSWLDGLLLVAISPRPVRLIVSTDLMTRPWLKGLARIMGVIPISPWAPKSTRSALDTAREALNNGELVCIFPEGGISRSGQLQPFRRGTLEILKGTSAKVIPVYLDEVWGSIFTFHDLPFTHIRRRAFFRPVSIWFGKPLTNVTDIHEVRQAVQDLGAEAVTGRKQRMMVLPRLMLRKCRKNLFKFKVADSTGNEATGGSLLMRTMILRRLLMREVFQPDEKYVGVLLPPTVAAVITNAAVTFSGRVACNLNYTVTNEILNACIRKAGIKHVLTSKKVLEKLDLKIDAPVILLDDFKDKVTTMDKIVGVLLAYLTPLALLDRILGVHKMKSDDELTVIFTSGSTGDPKGVVLTNHNIGSNVEAIDQVIHLRSDDTLLGILPFFHSFGFMVTLWTVMGLDVRCVYHTSPLDAKLIGQLCRKWGVTVLLATPTFLRSYMRRCEPEDFAKLEIVVAGAEKLPTSLSDEFEAKFGVRPVEGYGATELSPLVSVNVPPKRSQSGDEGLKEGSVGRPVPGVTAKIVDPDTGESLPPDTPGMLLVKGPNVMKGYLGDPQKTDEVVRDGWYVTGDIAIIDRRGFIQITARLSRFSKIGGEMIPHLNLEEAIQAFVQTPEDEEIRAVVTAVPDEKRGERLIVVHTKLDKTPQQICDHLATLGLPNLWLPSPDSFLEVEKIPVLGTGKLDLKGLGDVALKHYGK